MSAYTRQTGKTAKGAAEAGKLRGGKGARKDRKQNRSRVSRKQAQSQISYQPSSNGASAIVSISDKEKDIDNKKKQFEANLKAKMGTDHP